MDDKIKLYTPTTIDDNPFPQDESLDYKSSQQSSHNIYFPETIDDQPLPHKKVANELDSSSLNTRTRQITQQFDLGEDGSLSGLPSEARVTLERTGPQSTLTGVETAVLWDFDTVDTHDFHSTTSNNTRIIIPANMGGLYLFIFNGSFDTNTTGRRAFMIKKNGVEYVAMVNILAASGDATDQNLCAINIASAGDYFETYVTQTSGGGLNILSTRGRTFFSAVRLSF